MMAGASQSACKVQRRRRQDLGARFPCRRLAEDLGAEHVLAAQVAAGVFPDPYFGDQPAPDSRHDAIPSATTSPICRCQRQSLSLRLVVSQGVHDARDNRERWQLWLHFGGINYRGEIWLNGHRIADTTAVAGAYRTYDFDVTGLRESRRRQCAGCRDIRAHRKGSGHQLGRLESLLRLTRTWDCGAPSIS